ncbi:hypothetical protein EZ437_20935 [Pedobacter psychroterrae]|uniref:Uncharacterized protein n=1 Tax=Pedobacter psychroterrae TaxID=2530453 RepID=A0A4R0NCR1_9SPHI|nr:hypothetical protein EZ437_20935 [Pedobacter psychroterrae]
MEIQCTDKKTFAAHAYSVKNSPWKNGKGDLVRDFVESCNRHMVADQFVNFTRNSPSVIFKVLPFTAFMRPLKVPLIMPSFL